MRVKNIGNCGNVEVILRKESVEYYINYKKGKMRVKRVIQSGKSE